MEDGVQKSYLENREGKCGVNICSLSSAGRAYALQAWGRRFKSYSEHQIARLCFVLSISPTFIIIGTVIYRHYYGRPYVMDVNKFTCWQQGRLWRWYRLLGNSGSWATLCGFSSSGRAPPCQGGGSGFEPRHPLQSKILSHCGRIFLLYIGSLSIGLFVNSWGKPE